MRTPGEFADRDEEPIGIKADEECARPRVEASPDDVNSEEAGSEARVRTIVCQTPEFASSPFCDTDRK